MALTIAQIQVALAQLEIDSKTTDNIIRVKTFKNFLDQICLLIAGVSDGSYTFDTIAELTANAGVTVDGVLLKDGGGTYVAQVNGTSLYMTGVIATDTGINTNSIAEETTGSGVTIDLLLVRDGIVISKPAPAAVNVTGNISAAQFAGGLITSTSAAAVAATTPTATAIAALTGAVRGTSQEFIIDNSLGANTVTLTLDGSITVMTAVVTGGDTLTVASGKVGIFKVYFISGTAALISRIA